MTISRITIESPFRVAMLACTKRQRNLGRFGAQVRQAVQHHTGERSISSWNANLSYRTANILKKNGVL